MAQAKVTEEQLKALEAEHGRIAHVVGFNGEWEAVFRKAKGLEYKMYKRNIVNDAARADAQDLLARQLVVFPSRTEFDKLLDEYPGIPEACTEAFQKLLGMTTDQLAK